MVFPSRLGSTLRRTEANHLSRTFRRYKSLTAAIERGRQGAPDRPLRPRTRTPPGDFRGSRPRAEVRRERFGPPSDFGDNTRDPSERSYASRDGKPRSSRFGRVGPPRSRDDAPSRFRENREGPLWRTEGNLARQREDRIDGRERPPYHSEDRQPRQDRDVYGRRDERPSRREDALPRSYGSGNGFSDRQPRYSRRVDTGPPRSRFDEGERGGQRQARPERPLDGRDSASSHIRERPRREQGERSQRRDASQRAEDSTRTTRPTDNQRDLERGPEVLPYFTAASEFIYGYSSVLAAVKANRRRLYNLYVHSRGASRDGLMSHIRALKLFPITQEVGDEYMRAMDKASSGRPHNGVILESSPLPVPPITELKEASRASKTFRVTVDSQSAEDAVVNGKKEIYSYKSAGWRHPLILYVDGVLDEGNLGAIARSAYFLGVDAIVTPTRQTAPWSHIALKASAGAAEAIPLFKVGESTDFLGKSSRAGWRIYASDAIPTPPAMSGEKEDQSSNIVYTVARSTKRLPVDHCPVAEHPTILMMGAEGTGLRDSLLNLAHYKVGIKHGREVDEIGVDSLNVSVAASILCYEMLQKPLAKAASDTEEALF